MTKKKISKEQQMKYELQKLNEELREVRGDKNQYQSILNQIEKIIQPDTSYTRARFSFADLPTEVIKLELYKRQHEGAIYPLRDVIESQREIIRWLIKPSSADNSKELEMFKKMR